MAVKLAIDHGVIVDELGALEDKIAVEAAKHAQKMAPDLARASTLRSEMLKWAEQDPAEAAPVFSGKQYVATISACKRESHVKSIEAVFHRLGMMEFFAHVEIALGTLRALLPKHEHEQFIGTERTGPRSVKLIRKPAA